MYPIPMFTSVYNPASEMFAKKGNIKRNTVRIKKNKNKKLSK